MNNAKCRVAIVYQYVAHYREPVFRALLDLGARSGVEYVIAADVVSNIPSLRLVDYKRFTTEYPNRWRRLRNVWILNRYLWQRGLLSFLIRERPRAIIFLGDVHYLSTWIACLLARLLRAKVFMWTHGLRWPERGLKALLRRAYYRLSHGLLLYGPRAKTLLQAAGFPAHRLHVIYNSLDHEAHMVIRNELLVTSPQEIKAQVLGSSNDQVLLFVGRLERFKNIDLLLEALAIIAKNRRDIRLVCVGDGPARSHFEDLARDLRISDLVTFWGPCYDERLLGKLIYLSDLSVSPGPLGLFAIHSLAFGTPVVFGDAPVDHFPEAEAVTVGVTGAHFHSGSAQSLAETVISSLRTLAKPAVIESCFRAVDRNYTPTHQAALVTNIVLAAQSSTSRASEVLL